MVGRASHAAPGCISIWFAFTSPRRCARRLHPPHAHTFPRLRPTRFRFPPAHRLRPHFARRRHRTHHAHTACLFTHTHTPRTRETLRRIWWFLLVPGAMLFMGLLPHTTTAGADTP